MSAPLWPQATPQASSSNQAPLFLSGTVVEEPGSHPLKKVMVQVVAEDGQQGPTYSSTTDADGRFRVEDIKQGRYRLFFEKSGFSEINSRGHRTDEEVVSVSAGKPVDDLVIHMLAAAVITGRVTDEDGDPMSNVHVFVEKKTPGKPHRTLAGMASTNDLGEYRVSGLFPGQYWIAAMPQPNPRDYERRPEGKTSARDPQPEMRYVTTYYPGTTDSAQAASLALKSGEEMPVNLTLAPTRTYRIRGTITALSPGQTTEIELTSKTGDSIGAAEVGGDGTFEIHGVSPGSYTLKAYTTEDSSVLMVRQDVTMAAADIEGLKLVPMPAFAVSGHLRADPSGMDLSQFSVNLRLADISDDSDFYRKSDFFGEDAQVNRQGSFSWKNVNPGNYILRLFGGNGKDSFFLKSAHAGANNAEASFSLNGPAVLDLVVSNTGGIVDGVVTGRDKQGNEVAVSNVQVVAVPEEQFRVIPDRFGETATDQFGAFTLRGLAPGTYTLFAWQDLADELYRDPDFLKSQQSNGSPLKVEEGSRQTVNLKLSFVSDDLL